MLAVGHIDHHKVNNRNTLGSFHGLSCVGCLSYSVAIAALAMLTV